jgi:hypothetical protein
VVVYGQSPFPAIEYNPEAGPSSFFAGTALADPRPTFSFVPGQDFGSPVCAFSGTDNIMTLDIVPYTKSNTAIAGAFYAASGTPATLVSSSSATTGVAVSQSIIRPDTAATVTGLLAIDGYTSVSGYVSNGTSGTAGNLFIVTANSAGPLLLGMTVTPPSGSAFTITGYGPATGSTGVGTGFTGVYTISGPAQAISTLGSPGTFTAALSANGSNAVAACRIPFGSAGTLQLWNPQALTARAVSITAGSATSGGIFYVLGYDVYGYPVTEKITAVLNTTVNGTKAFKYIASVTPQFADAPSGGPTYQYTVGTADIFGLPLRSDSFGDIAVNYATSLTAVTLQTSATGYTAANTAPAVINTTGDVRGTYASASNTATNRLVVRQTVRPYNAATAVGLFGVTQA